MSEIRVASMFAGIGGICIGFKQAGYDLVWANEVDSAACKTYRRNLGDSWLRTGDIKKIAPQDVPDMDVLTAGFPCQSFSIAGSQRGFNDPRGNLFFEIAKIIDKKRPKAIFLENVSNLLEHDCGKTFLVIYNSLVQFGYVVHYRIMEANLYGNLPQTRSRIFVVAFLDFKASEKFRFPDPIDLTININDLVRRCERKHEVYYYQHNSDFQLKYGHMKFDYNSIYRMSDKGPTRVRNQFCPTLTANMGTYPDRVPIVRDNYGVRKLTLRECLDFQGFPSDFKFPNTISINDAYKQIGNSVCIPVVKRIADKLKLSLTLT